MEKPFSIELLVAQVANLLKSREVLTRTYKETPSTPATSLAVSTVDDLFLRKLNAYLEEHITNDALNVEMLATEMGMSYLQPIQESKRSVRFISGRIHQDRTAETSSPANEKRGKPNQRNCISGQASPLRPISPHCFQKQYGKTPTEFMKEC